MSTGNSDIDESDDGEEGYDYYYNSNEDTEMEPNDPHAADPEYFEFMCLSKEDVERLFNECVENLCASLPIKPSLAKLLLHTHSWNTSEIITRYKEDASKLLIDSRIKASKPSEIDSQAIRSAKSLPCSICLLSFSGEHFRALTCGHWFCKECWATHFETQISQGITTSMECQDCNLLVPEDFVLNILNKSSLREKYQQFSFSDYVKSHPKLRFCPGTNCSTIIFAKECQSKRVICKFCKTIFCFKCGSDYHAPTDCETIKKWLTKCADDSETANYISAHTKDCPKCSICIEKNGGCNHMQCYSCKFDFCWMCLGDWNSHGSEYYECSRYKENPNIANESVHAQAREALKKYLFYFERWENHARSLRLEEETHQKIIDRINEKVMASEGTWIDWQYLRNAAALLAKCRYTLQYTYPYAYYMENGPRKQLFEYQQAQLEAEIENLSWKVERAESTDRGDLENQMDVAEKLRTTLLKDFLSV
ncbi:potential E3 ubiquitin-protein ligase ariadne-2-like [Argiope bruennichi]|uniref:potential E3 ubiquitin-protein ligase ariadne-2-like n=1 Tax=Argiope bruennichi TaxID=94029 RepID=UPI0024954D5B|nr:potential E3 ubiquitin-protein ligase ariadne-2-like [Argiope bruennichi]